MSNYTLTNWRNTLRYLFSPNETTIGLRATGYYMQCRALDRTATYADFVDVCPVPEFRNITLAEAIDNAVTRLQQVGRPIKLLWSGGIDSTAVLYALVQKGVQFTVVFNTSSENEYPILAGAIKAGAIAGVTPEYYENTIIINTDNCIYTTGELADQLFGHGKYKLLSDVERNSGVLVAVENAVLPREVFEETKTSITTLLGKDVSSVTLAEYLFAMNFIFKYTYVKLRLGSIKLKAFSTNPDDISVMHFYDTDVFQQYALSNYETNCKFTDITEHKLALKQFILSNNGDLDYFNNKTKHQSLMYSHYA